MAAEAVKAKIFIGNSPLHGWSAIRVAPRGPTRCSEANGSARGRFRKDHSQFLPVSLLKQSLSSARLSLFITVAVPVRHPPARSKTGQGGIAAPILNHKGAVS